MAYVFKEVLANGLTVLIHPNHLIPKVAIQLWYDVGSKDEPEGKKGIAHLIEHMVFKGTTSMSETDINEICAKLSGSTNAFTSYDYTGFLFEFPTQHWPIAFPLLADCMQNCTFKQDLLNAELRAVIQELKLYRDDYGSMLVEELLAKTFKGFPYEHPIIGHKEQLWEMTSEDLKEFYHTHYIPNNAVLVVVGDIDPAEVVALAYQYFEIIPPNWTYKRKPFDLEKLNFQQPVSARLHREVQQPVGLVSYTMPGARSKDDYSLDVLAWLTGTGVGSRLYQRLVDREQLATDVDATTYDLFEKSAFFLEFVPKDIKNIDTIINIIKEEMNNIGQGFTELELQRAQKKAENSYLSSIEGNQKIAFMLGKYFLCTGDEQYIFHYLKQDPENVRKKVMELVTTNMKPEFASTGVLLPFTDGERDAWFARQEADDAHDQEMLEKRPRTTPLEPPLVAPQIKPQAPRAFNFPKHLTMGLDTGLRVLVYNNQELPKIELLLELKGQYVYDPVDKQGISNFMNALLLEGTKNYPEQALGIAFESYGMEINTAAGYISITMLASDLRKGLEFLEEMVTNATFDPVAIEKVRDQILAEIRAHWDNPFDFVDDLVKQQIYGSHPYSKSRVGTVDTIKNITRDDLLTWYKHFMSPQGARLCIVGNLEQYDIPQIFLETIVRWEGPPVPDIAFPLLHVGGEQKEHDYQINRDQIVLGFAGLSVTRADPDYDKLLIVDQILTGSLLGSMSSRLFQLREQTGMFYTIGGSLLIHADVQPGLVYIKTMVSRDHVDEAEKLIGATIEGIGETITEEEFAGARDAILNSLVDAFETNRSMALAFLVLDRFKLPPDYFDRRIQDFYHITLDQVKQAANRVLLANKLSVFKVGRLPGSPMGTKETISQTDTSEMPIVKKTD